MNIHTRWATQADLSFVSQDGYIPQEVVARKIDLHEIIVAEADQVLAGYLRLEYLWSEVPYVALIWVTPTYRKRGLGKAMLDFACSFLRERGHNALYSSSQANEPPPQAWHRHVGFQECGFIAGINDGGIGEVFFRKEL